MCKLSFAKKTTTYEGTKMIDLTELFCNIDDFWKSFEPLWKERQIAMGKQGGKRKASLSASEVMTIVVSFHTCGYRNFKTFYSGHLLKYHRRKFPGLPSYNRFLELKQTIVFPLHCYLMSKLGRATGIAFVDSTSFV